MTGNPTLGSVEKAINALIVSTNALADKVTAIQDQRRRDKRIVGAFIAVILLIGASLFYTTSKLGTACENANAAAAREHRLWTRTLALPKTADQPSPDPAVLAAFNQILDQTFPVRAC